MNKIPIRIRASFWVFSTLIAFFLSGGKAPQIFIWIAIIFFSVLVHEFGHALTALFFKKKPRIELVAMGGLTYYNAESLPFWKQFLITLNGPVFGFLLFLLPTLFLSLKGVKQGGGFPFLENLREVNLVWTLINLLPVIPLDGGQLLRILLEGYFRAKGLRAALLISAVIAFFGSLSLFLTQNFFPGAIFFFFAFDSFDKFRRLRNVRNVDRDQVAAIQKTACLNYEKGKKREAYEGLLAIEKGLDGEGLYLLHKIAFEEGDFSLVLALSGRVFQLAPSREAGAEIALRNAHAAAGLHQVRPTLGWLQTACLQGIENLQEIVAEKGFDGVRSTRAFQDFIKKSIPNAPHTPG